ncbi:MAG TPA: carboxypeptidase-like regulatory domain-containing protein [Bacteroidales bacterium]|nr:carboxypeptidase-like regulatory domain-containing protein [Bacteroidales bacterium]HQK69266.1 carboxypeptidase-like regulatory domain-containing protein [Bacteroidales bacterium]
MKTLKLIMYLSFMSLISCEPKVDVSGNINVTTNTAQNGMIQGKVVVPTVENNLLVLKGIKGATVEVTNTNYSIVTSENGIYAIDGIPTGSYTIKAKWNDIGQYTSATQSVIVTRQSVSTVPDIELGIGSKKLIIYGKVFYPDKVSPFSNKLVKICNQSNRPVTSTMTSLTGEYGFDINYSTNDGDNMSYNLSYSYNNISYGFNYFSYIGQYPHGVININAYGAWITGPKP